MFVEEVWFGFGEELRLELFWVFSIGFRLQPGFRSACNSLGMGLFIVLELIFPFYMLISCIEFFCLDFDFVY